MISTPSISSALFPVDTGRKLNVRKPFRRRPGRLLNVLCTFNFKSCVYGVIIFRTIKIDNSVLGQYLIVPFLWSNHYRTGLWVSVRRVHYHMNGQFQGIPILNLRLMDALHCHLSPFHGLHFLDLSYREDLIRVLLQRKEC